MTRTAVIGVGRLGQHHARLLSSLPSSKLVAVVDTDEKRGEKIAKSANAEWTDDYRKLIGRIDAAVIAVPTPLHYRIGKELLENGVHCLVEKPLCQKIEEAEE